ncbi:MAG: LysR substrate-binding domain-containing protein [Litoreibacter sp.]|nr:LysR substrate-binding domain-containing protein [Litoreibacter sp.]
MRGDATLLLCYEAETTDRLEFGPSVSRSSWGTDFLVPLIGGELRYAVNSDGTIPSDTPAITYPTDSYFGDVLRRSNRAFSTSDIKTNSFCTTAFSSGILEMVARGLGVAWAPFSMAYRELETGKLVSLAQSLGKVPLDVAVYGDTKSQLSISLLDLWSNGAKKRN